MDFDVGKDSKSVEVFMVLCVVCYGSGWVVDVGVSPLDHVEEVMPVQVLCSECRGSGWVKTELKV